MSAAVEVGPERPDGTGAVRERQRVAPPPLPALVVGTVTHRRLRPIGHRVDHRHYSWLVDLDDLPDLPRPLRWLASFRPEDHLDAGRLGGGIRGDLVRFLSRRGVAVEPGDRLLLLAHPRSVGHGFNPLSVHWCLTAANEVRAVVLEVHNTYGQRHAYLLHPDARGRARVGKEFYVSPFNDSSGTYAVRLRLDERVAVSVRLERESQVVLTATLAGRTRPGTVPHLLWTALTLPLMTHRVSALIRAHGTWLWLRGLPVRPRPDHEDVTR
ncbi:DUF1365 domain-containing protein [Ornithinimicrobium cavernae]|uniref:DUF1365 domain-containing protein n=1 Tax=Ornithinimicrobium cavernae TaxID=2666047 RepID=UPI001F3F4D6C|nr:DUF1365 domain-containing protein [Ornithinimicrobium cavernae]